MATILLVEDDEYIRRMLVLRLERREYVVETAVNGEIGVARAKELRPDLVLMDMHMPVMDGHEAVRTLRAGGYEGLIVAITATVVSAEKATARAAGCDDIISKPIGGDFEAKIHSLLKGGAT